MAYIDEGWERGTFAPQAPSYKRVGSERRFGVELEFQDLPDSVFDLEGETVFGAKEDCSVEGGEFDSPILYADQGLDAVDHFCGLADDHGFVAGQGAGYHLHLDMSKESAEGLKRIALAYHYSKDFWLGAVPSQRRHFTYSRPHTWRRGDVLGWQTLGDAREFAGSQDRYYWCNVSSYWCKQTFEIRCHESLIDAFAVNAWIIAHTRFCDAMSGMGVGKITRIFGRKKPTEIFRELRAVIKEPTVSEHLQKRYRQFN